MIRDIAEFLTWVAAHKAAFLCYLTDDCDCPWVDYTEEELEVLLLEYQTQKEIIARQVTDGS